MLTITFINDGTGTKEKGNYHWKVYVNEKIIAQGHIKGHIRKLGWQALVGKFEKICWESFCKESDEEFKKNNAKNRSDMG